MTFSTLTGGSSEGLGAFRFFLKQDAVWCLKKDQNASFETLSGQICFKENLNASRPFEHPPVRAKNVKTLSRWDHRLQIQTSSWHLNGFPVDSNIVGSRI